MPNAVLPRRVFGCMILAVLIVVVAICSGCGGGSAGSTAGTTPNPTPTPSPTPTPVPSSGLLLKVGSATVPTGGIFQYQLLLTEPKPIGTSSTRPTLPSGPVGPVRGVAVNDASGQAVGIAVISGTNIAIRIQSPGASLGTDIDYPILILTMPVIATTGSFTIALDPSSTFFNGPSQYTIQENLAGTLTVGGTLSITDVVPGGGIVKDGDTISVLGMGFDQNTTKIQVNNDPSATQTFVSSTQIDVKIVSPCVPDSNPCVPAPTLQLDGDRIRAINTSTNETVEYFSYDRTEDAPGASSNPLVTLVHPMFSQQHLLAGSFPYTAGGTQFTGIALQNTATVDATMRIELLDSSGSGVVTPIEFILPARRQMVRDIADFFPSIPTNAAKVRATVLTGPAVKMLGMLGDTSSGTAAPVIVTGQ